MTTLVLQIKGCIRSCIAGEHEIQVGEQVYLDLDNVTTPSLPDKIIAVVTHIDHGTQATTWDRQYELEYDETLLNGIVTALTPCHILEAPRCVSCCDLLNDRVTILENKPDANTTYSFALTGDNLEVTPINNGVNGTPILVDLSHFLDDTDTTYTVSTLSTGGLVLTSSTGAVQTISAGNEYTYSVPIPSGSDYIDLDISVAAVALGLPLNYFDTHKFFDLHEFFVERLNGSESIGWNGETSPVSASVKRFYLNSSPTLGTSHQFTFLFKTTLR